VDERDPWRHERSPSLRVRKSRERSIVITNADEYSPNASSAATAMAIDADTLIRRAPMLVRASFQIEAPPRIVAIVGRRAG